MELPEELESIERIAFDSCQCLRRIVISLKDDMIKANAFYNCPNLKTVNLVGGIHKTAVSSLHLESWRSEMMREFNRINQVLPTTRSWSKTAAMQEWMESVIHRLDHYKAEHKSILIEATTLLELALWKTNLKNDHLEKEGVRTTRGQRKRARKEISVTSGASIVIKDVLPFLELT